MAERNRELDETEATNSTETGSDNVAQLSEVSEGSSDSDMSDQTTDFDENTPAVMGKKRAGSALMPCVMGPCYSPISKRPNVISESLSEVKMHQGATPATSNANVRRRKRRDEGEDSTKREGDSSARDRGGQACANPEPDLATAARSEGRRPRRASKQPSFSQSAVDDTLLRNLIEGLGRSECDRVDWDGSFDQLSLDQYATLMKPICQQESSVSEISLHAAARNLQAHMEGSIEKLRCDESSADRLEQQKTMVMSVAVSLRIVHLILVVPESETGRGRARQSGNARPLFIQALHLLKLLVTWTTETGAPRRSHAKALPSDDLSELFVTSSCAALGLVESIISSQRQGAGEDCILLLQGILASGLVSAVPRLVASCLTALRAFRRYPQYACSMLQEACINQDRAEEISKKESKSFQIEPGITVNGLSAAYFVLIQQISTEDPPSSDALEEVRGKAMLLWDIFEASLLGRDRSAPASSVKGSFFPHFVEDLTSLLFHLHWPCAEIIAEVFLEKIEALVDGSSRVKTVDSHRSVLLEALGRMLKALQSARITGQREARALAESKQDTPALAADTPAGSLSLLDRCSLRQDAICKDFFQGRIQTPIKLELAASRTTTAEFPSAAMLQLLVSYFDQMPRRSGEGTTADDALSLHIMQHVQSMQRQSHEKQVDFWMACLRACVPACPGGSVELLPVSAFAVEMNRSGLALALRRPLLRGLATRYARILALIRGGTLNHLQRSRLLRSCDAILLDAEDAANVHSLLGVLRETLDTCDNANERQVRSVTRRDEEQWVD